MRWDKCENCEETNVNRHKLSKHEGVRFPCEHCGAEFTAQGNLNKWVLAIAKTLKSQKAKILKFKRTETLPWAKICHFRTFSSCYKSFWALILYVYWSTSSFIYLLSWLWKRIYFHEKCCRHKLTEHEGVRYACDQCGAEFTAQGNLRRHKLSKHEQVDRG